MPGPLAPAVRFWTEVFTRYSREELIVHDRLEPERVYAVLSGREYEDPAAVAARVQALADERGLPADQLRVQRGMREEFRAGLLGARRYRPLVEAALAREGLPLDLAALPLVESSYNCRATSGVGAAGIWQIMPVTARMYLPGHGRLRRTDLRRDAFTASAVAAKLLRDLRSTFPNWPLALTAYNHGPGGIDRARRELGTDDLGAIVQGYHGPRFGFASRNFYAEFLAARHVAATVERYFPDLAPGRIIEYQVKAGDTLSAVAMRHGIPLPKLRSLNALEGARAHLIRPGDRLMIEL
jgi:membrane-bound lytic murein transglycosylase D